MKSPFSILFSIIAFSNSLRLALFRTKITNLLCVERRNNKLKIVSHCFHFLILSLYHIGRLKVQFINWLTWELERLKKWHLPFTTKIEMDYLMRMTSCRWSAYPEHFLLYRLIYPSSLEPCLLKIIEPKTPAVTQIVSALKSNHYHHWVILVSVDAVSKKIMIVKHLQYFYPSKRNNNPKLKTQPISLQMVDSK